MGRPSPRGIPFPQLSHGSEMLALLLKCQLLTSCGYTRYLPSFSNEIPLPCGCGTFLLHSPFAKPQKTEINRLALVGFLPRNLGCFQVTPVILGGGWLVPPAWGFGCHRGAPGGHDRPVLPCQPPQRRSGGGNVNPASSLGPASRARVFNGFLKTGDCLVVSCMQGYWKETSKGL